MTNITTIQVPQTKTGPGGGMGMGIVLNAGNAVTNAVIQQGQNNVNSRRAYKYNIKSMRENADIQNRQTEFNMGIQQQMQKEMWDYTSYENQIKHMKEAGLNPALMYGIGGGGGQSTGGGLPTGSGGGGTGGAAQGSSPGMSIESILATRAQMELLQAQKENIQADTANKIAQTPNTEADTRNKVQQHSNLEAEAQNIAQDTNKKIQEIEAQVIQNKINNTTAQDQIKRIKAEAIGQVLINNLTIAQTTNTKADTELKGKQGELIDSNVLKNNAEINKMQQDIAQGWEKLSQSEKIMKVNALIQEVEQLYITDWGKKFTKHDPQSIIKQIDAIMGTKKPSGGGY